MKKMVGAFLELNEIIIDVLEVMEKYIINSKKINIQE